MYLKDNNGTPINTWSKNVISLLSSLGYAYIWYSANVSGMILNGYSTTNLRPVHTKLVLTVRTLCIYIRYI